jgi:hypothetical protein
MVNGMTKRVRYKGKYITHYECKDCGQVMDNSRTMRPNNKFCESKCMEYVKSFKHIVRGGMKYHGIKRH